MLYALQNLLQESGRIQTTTQNRNLLCYKEVVNFVLFIQAVLYLENLERNMFRSGKNWDESMIFWVDEILKLKINLFLKITMYLHHRKNANSGKGFRGTWNVTYSI